MIIDITFASQSAIAMHVIVQMHNAHKYTHTHTGWSFNALFIFGYTVLRDPCSNGLMKETL